MKNTLNITFLLLLSGLLLGGCAKKIPVEPELQYVNPPDRIKSVQLPAKVTLVNNNPEDKLRYFGDMSIHTLEGNMHKWTDQAIELATKEIEQRGGQVTDDSDQKIYLSFEGTDFIVGWTFRCVGTLKVETSSGYKMEYNLANNTGGTVHRACGGAITLSIIEFLNDKDIVEFLNTSSN